MEAVEREPCFSCAEPVALDAKVCPHCRRDMLVEVGLEFTVHEGSISSLSRALRGLAYIQIDAKVNPGNSGGPLIDSFGRVVGVVCLKHMMAEGIGLALPINYVYTGAQPLLAPPIGVPATGRFEDMMASAKRATAAQGPEESAASEPLPMLVAASVDQYDRLLAHIMLPAAQSPGFREVTLKVWVGTEMICDLKGDVKEWAPFDESSPPISIAREIQLYLAGQARGLRLYLGESPLRWDLCPRERMRGAVVLELIGADPQASRLQVYVRRYYGM